jgi:cytochrome c-type biogenesis protein
LGFAGLLPFPERSVAPGLLGHALRGGSGLMFGAAFAISASPCVGPVLGATLVLAGSTRTATEGAVLLLFYSLGLALPFVATGIAFARVIGPLRWLRDRFAIARSAGGGSLVALGALIFFGRFWWLNVLVSRALSVVGLQ